LNFRVLRGKTRKYMANDDLIEYTGLVINELGGGKYLIQIDEGASCDVIAHLSGKMRQNKIKVVLGDQIKVAVSPYDPSRGRITYRFKT